MLYKQLTLTLLAVFWLLLPAKVSALEAMPHGTLESVDPNIERPQWSVLGMEHILAVSGQSNITPPSPVRLASQGRRLAGAGSNAATCSTESAAQTTGLYSHLHSSNRFRAIWTRGYIYLIRCLRL